LSIVRYDTIFIDTVLINSFSSESQGDIADFA